jgi:hypothetical protein
MRSPDMTKPGVLGADRSGRRQRARGLWRPLTLMLLATAAAPALGQYDRSFPPGTITLQRDPNDPSMLLNRHLRSLSTIRATWRR